MPESKTGLEQVKEQITQRSWADLRDPIGRR
jgi:hypothetical protein